MQIAIEGMDGVGKTTIAQQLAAHYNFTYVATPMKYLFSDDMYIPIEKKMYSNENDILKAWFFGLGNIYNILEHKACNIILDRHLVSNYCKRKK